MRANSTGQLYQTGTKIWLYFALDKKLLNSLPNERTPNAEDWEQLSEKFRESLDEKIEKLQKCV
ncbi:MAG: hypothetical protein ACPGF9_04115, partial [Paracoccaceae bacterium]